jgi:DNA modification methylase
MSQSIISPGSVKDTEAPIFLHRGDYRKTLADVRANLIFTSPPYNIGSKAPRCSGFRKFGLYDPKSFGSIRDYPDALPEEEYQNQQEQFLLWCADHLAENGILVYNHKLRRRKFCVIHPAEWILRPSVKRRLCLVDEVVWDRGSTHNHGRGLLWPQSERLFVFRRVGDNYRFDNHDGLEFRSDVWRISRVPSGSGHNAPFPEKLAIAVVTAWSSPGDLVVDPHAGSGTVALACRRLDRRFAGSEILKKYYRLALERLSREEEA